VAGSFEDGNGHLGSIKGGEFLEWLRAECLLASQEDCSMGSVFTENSQGGGYLQ
jgi:hypothetical protein